MTDNICKPPKKEVILKKACLKLKLQEWIDSEKNIFDLFQESGFSISDLINNWNNIDSFDDEKLLLVVLNLILEKNNYRLKNLISKSEIIDILNECVLLDNTKHYFNNFGYLIKKESLPDASKTEYSIIYKLLNQKIIPVARIGYENKKLWYAEAISLAIKILSDSICKFLDFRKCKYESTQERSKFEKFLNGKNKDKESICPIDFDGGSVSAQKNKEILTSNFDKLITEYRNPTSHKAMEYTEKEFTNAITFISSLYDILESAKYTDYEDGGKEKNVLWGF